MEIAFGLAGTVLGLLLGKLWDRRDERQRWLRDAQARAHVEYVAAFQELRQVLRRIATLDHASEDWKMARSRRRDLWSGYNASLVQVELYGTPTVYAAALEVDRHLRQLSVLSSHGAMTLDGWHSERLAMDTAMRICVDEIRSQLDLKPHPDRSTWVATRVAPSEPTE